MTALPDVSTPTAVIADRRFPAALAIAALAGLVRGFSGFGSALVYMPLAAAVYDPRMAAATLLLIDTAGGIPFTLRALRAIAYVIVATAALVSLLLLDPWLR